MLCAALLAGTKGWTQVRFSIATDLAVLRNLSPDQHFWSVGQTVQGDFHLSARETFFAGLCYFGTGNFRNNFVATATSPLTFPATQTYTVGGGWRMREFSLGWKHYFKGSFDAEDAWNLYGLAAFGLVFTAAQNDLLTPMDTSVYRPQPAPMLGIGAWKRLTMDLGLGFEYPLGGNFCVYGETKIWLHTSDYPSPYLHRNERVPLPVLLKGGIRILFGD